jgi:signal transduction histidine kinase
MIENFGKILTSEDFDSIAIKYQDLKFDSVTPFYPIPTKLVLPFHDNSVSIDFVAIDPVMPKQVRYQYKLEGYSKEWTRPGSNTMAVFQNLPEGNYIFKLKAKSAAGVWSETSYSFRVMPPWWRTWWAYACYICTVGGLLYAIYRYRINTIEHDQAEQLNIMVATQEQERRRISRDLHDDVGIKLSAQKLYLSSLHEKSSEAKNRAIASLTQNSEKLIGDVMNDVRHLLHNLSPMVLDEFGFIEAVQAITDKINETGQIHIQLIAFGIEQRLPKDYELALYRITQELINNALKHAQAKQVTLQIGQRDHKLIIMMEDNGIGFNTESQTEGYGLHNLAARTKLMKGIMKIDSQQGKGTSVYIEIPYNFN